MLIWLHWGLKSKRFSSREDLVWSKWMVHPDRTHLCKFGLVIWSSYICMGEGDVSPRVCFYLATLIPGQRLVPGPAPAEEGGVPDGVCVDSMDLGLPHCSCSWKTLIARWTYLCQPFLSLKYGDNTLFFILQSSLKNRKEWNVLIRKALVAKTGRGIQALNKQGISPCARVWDYWFKKKRKQLIIFSLPLSCSVLLF